MHLACMLFVILTRTNIQVAHCRICLLQNVHVYIICDHYAILWEMKMHKYMLTCKQYQICQHRDRYLSWQLPSACFGHRGKLLTRTVFPLVEPLILKLIYWYFLERSLQEKIESGIIIMIQTTSTIVMISNERVNLESLGFEL